MFRQRLKRGHHVGSTSKSGSYSPNVASQFHSQSAGNTSLQDSNVSADSSWHWGESTTVHQSQPSKQHLQPPVPHKENDPNQFTPKTNEMYQPAGEQKNDPPSFHKGQNQTSFVNGAELQRRTSDDWNWGSEDNWGDWGTNDATSDVVNNNNQQQFHQHQGYEQQQQQQQQQFQYHQHQYQPHQQQQHHQHQHQQQPQQQEPYYPQLQQHQQSQFPQSQQQQPPQSQEHQQLPQSQEHQQSLQSQQQHHHPQSQEHQQPPQVQQLQQTPQFQQQHPHHPQSQQHQQTPQFQQHQHHQSQEFQQLPHSQQHQQIQNSEHKNDEYRQQLHPSSHSSDSVSYQHQKPSHASSESNNNVLGSHKSHWEPHIENNFQHQSIPNQGENNNDAQPFDVAPESSSNIQNTFQQENHNTGPSFNNETQLQYDGFENYSEVSKNVHHGHGQSHLLGHDNQSQAFHMAENAESFTQNVREEGSHLSHSQSQQHPDYFELHSSQVKSCSEVPANQTEKDQNIHLHSQQPPQSTIGPREESWNQWNIESSDSLHTPINEGPSKEITHPVSSLTQDLANSGNVGLEENWGDDWNWEKESVSNANETVEVAEDFQIKSTHPENPADTACVDVPGEIPPHSEKEKSDFETEGTHLQESDGREDSLSKVSNDIPNPNVASWDDEWGDGWEAKPLSTESSLKGDTLYDGELNARISNVIDQHPDEFIPVGESRVEAYEEKREYYERVRGISSGDSVPEVPNIEVLNQELQGIFSVPSESSLVLNLESQISQQDTQPLNAQSLEENNGFVDNSQGRIESNELSSQHVDNLHFYVGADATTVANVGDGINHYLNPKDVLPEVNLITDDSGKGLADAVESAVTLQDASVSPLTSSKPVSVELPQSSAARVPSNQSLEALSCPSSHPSLHSQEIQPPSSTPSSVSLSRPSSNLSAHMGSAPTPSAPPLELEQVSLKTSNLVLDSPPSDEMNETASLSSSKEPPPASFPPLSGPSGNIPSLQARKGSPFQPPVFRRPSSGTIPPPSLKHDQEVVKEEKDQPRNPLLQEPCPQDNTVKLSIASPPLPTVGSNSESLPMGLPSNNVPLVVPGVAKSEVAPRDEPSYVTEIPPAHLGSVTRRVQTPKVRTLSTMNNTPTSPAVLDLSHLSIKQESNLDPPNFSRMVPGESTKGESSAAAFQTPHSAPPAMPSGRVVTGNANPQPVPSARVKQEDIRSPPDGPDTGSMVDQGPGVVPPVRSETIGSEDHAACSLPPDRRDEKDGRRDREPWDRDRDYYSERYRDRKRDGRDFYRSDSPPPGRRPADRDYEDRRRLRRDTDEEEDDDDDTEDGRRKYAEGKRERRQRAYQDELDRYGDRSDRDRGYRKDRRHRDYRYPHEEDDPYFEGRSDRSRPISRSSSYGNLDTESSQEHSSHHEDYFDRGLRGRERDYTRYKKREDKERDPYARAYNPYPDQFGSRDMYDPQSYYYYYQNYQKYLEQHPYYREYYRHYYGRYGYATGGDSLIDDKASTRSGRSSVNDDLKKSSLSSGDISGVPSVTDEAVNDVVQRKSPHFFTGPHLTASFTPGGKLLLVLPNDPKDGEKPTVQVRNVQKMLAIDPDFALRIQKMKTYPGPLTVTETHKDIVLRFCEEKAKEAMADESLSDKESVVLIWDYLSLLVKQNGNVCGADLANLLVKGRSSGHVVPGLTPDERQNEVPVGADVLPKEEDGMETPSGGGSDQADLIRRFTEYLCLGMKKEAVDYAIREGLWGYAMTLAAKMDSVTHARVMSAFIHSIPCADVLQTLIQHLSGKKPEVTKSYSLEKWGDWRQHLAMMVSNPTGNLQRDRSSIVALGDALAAKHRLHAAHLCYLAAEVEWGTFSNKDSKLVLIGSSPQQPFQLFASEDAIQRTEIYEFAKSLDVNNPMFFTFQSYKLIYALRLTECGFPNEALKYCEVISQAVMKQPSSFQVEFVSQVLELASQLKFHDVHYQMGEGEVSDMPDPEWLRNLQSVLYNMQCLAAEAQRCAESTPVQGAREDAQSRLSVRDPYSMENSAGMSPEYMSYAPHVEGDAGAEPPARPESSVPPDTAPERKFSGVPGIIPQYEERHNAHEVGPHESLPPYLNNEPPPTYNTSAPPSLSVYESTSPQPQPQPPSQSPPNHQSWQQQPQQSWESDQSNQPWQPEPPPQPQQDQWQPEPPQQPVSQWQNNPPNQWQPNQQPPQPWHQPTDQMDHHLPHDQRVSTPQEGTSQGDATQDFSASPSPTAGQRTAEEEEYWRMMSGKGNTTQDVVDNSVKEEAPSEKSDKETDAKSEDRKSSFLGSLFGGWRKGTNQAKLPDDKDPSIVWDDKQKKWVNKDASESEDAPPPPPPSDLVGGPPPGLSSLRGGNRKSRYVDPVGEKGRTKVATPNIFPPMPNASLPANAPGFPEQPAPVEAPHAPMQSYGQPEGPQNNPQVPVAQPNPPLIQQQSQESHNGDADSSGSIPMLAPGAGQPQPMFFNPAQFRTPQNATSNQPKRMGPARRTFNPQR